MIYFFLEKAKLKKISLDSTYYKCISSYMLTINIKDKIRQNKTLKREVIKLFTLNMYTSL